MEDFMISIQNRVKKVREHFGLTQAQFALRINKTSGLISLIETYRCNVSEDTIKRICNVFSVSEEWLRTGIGDMTQMVPVDKENIRTRIKKIRKENNLSMEKFASAIGYSKQLISFIESGKIYPSDELTRMVSKAFGVNMEWLMTGKGEMYGNTEEKLDEKLIDWLNNHPEVIRELRRRSGLD